MPIAPPKGVRYWLGTWSGRLILINAVVFVVLSIKSGSLFLPDTEALLAFGAKDPASLAAGEWWRLITPMFIHIGILHFAVNSYMLYVIGLQLERSLGARWFLLIYLAAGIAGNIASAVFSVNMSAGASGALFGLLGAGLFLERSLGRQNRAYLLTVVVNLAFGFLMSFIDNSAHIGGLVAGVVLTFAMINIRPNTLQRPRRAVGIAACAGLALAAAAGAYLGTNPQYVGDRLERAGDVTNEHEEQLMFYSQAISVLPDKPELRLKRARLLFLAGESKYAFHDLRLVIAAGGHEDEVAKLAEELSSRGMMSEAWQVRQFAEHGEIKP